MIDLYRIVLIIINMHLINQIKVVKLWRTVMVWLIMGCFISLEESVCRFCNLSGSDEIVLNYWTAFLMHICVITATNDSMYIRPLQPMTIGSKVPNLTVVLVILQCFSFGHSLDFCCGTSLRVWIGWCVAAAVLLCMSLLWSIRVEHKVVEGRLICPWPVLQPQSE